MYGLGICRIAPLRDNDAEMFPKFDFEGESYVAAPHPEVMRPESPLSNSG